MQDFALTTVLATDGEKLLLCIYQKGVYMSVEAFEEWEKMLAHRASVLAAEAARLAGVSTFTQEDLDEQVETLLNGYKV